MLPRDSSRVGLTMDADPPGRHGPGGEAARAEQLGYGLAMGILTIRRRPDQEGPALGGGMDHALRERWPSQGGDAMAGEVVTVYAGEKPPEYWDAAVFMAGPTQRPRTSDATSWLAEAVALLCEQWASRGRLVVFVPEPRTDSYHHFTSKIVDWMNCGLQLADVVMFWWPEDIGTQLAFMNMTWGARNDSQRVVMGTSLNMPEFGRLLDYADSHAISTATTLAGAVRTVLDKIGEGSRRSGAECGIPLPIWRTQSFQRWYAAQTTAGNTMLGARPAWTFGVGPDNRLLLYWALRVSMRIAAEDRVKSNEVVISRPDISVMALYQRGATLDDTIVVLIREFRSPASTPDGFVHELPGGSGPASGGALDQAASETEEETGLVIDINRVRIHGSRQLAGTLSAHHAHLFAVEITDDELAHLRTIRSRPHGVGDTERTWIEITTFGEIRRERLVDWATLGMIAEVLLATTS